MIVARLRLAPAWGNLRFPPTSPPSDTLQRVVREHGQSPYSRRIDAHSQPAKGNA